MQISYLLAYSILLGVALSASYYALKIPFFAILYLKRIVGVRVKPRRKLKFGKPKRRRSLVGNIYDAVFVFICGLIYSLYSYLAFDGVLRLLPILCGGISFFFTRKLILKPLRCFLTHSARKEKVFKSTVKERKE